MKNENRDELKEVQKLLKEGKKILLSIEILFIIMMATLIYLFSYGMLITGNKLNVTIGWLIISAMTLILICIYFWKKEIYDNSTIKTIRRIFILMVLIFAIIIPSCVTIFAKKQKEEIINSEANVKTTVNEVLCFSREEKAKDYIKQKMIEGANVEIIYEDDENDAYVNVLTCEQENDDGTIRTWIEYQVHWPKDVPINFS